jgi:hypothetical protein
MDGEDRVLISTMMRIDELALKRFFYSISTFPQLIFIARPNGHFNFFLFVCLV